MFGLCPVLQRSARPHARYRIITRDAPTVTRAVIIASYTIGDAGSVEAEIPDVCDLSPGSKAVCAVAPHHLRARLTGPKHDLIVVRCRAHGRAFTLYPPGFVPYGRTPLVLRAPDGDAPDDLFAETLFSAASDAAGGKTWPDSEPRFWRTGGARSTQRRRVRLATLLLGLAAMADPLRERIAIAIDIPFTRLQDRSRVAMSRSVIACGRVVLATIEEAQIGTRDLLSRLLAAGEIVGLWGPPLRWDQATRRLRSLSAPFRQPGTPPTRAPP